MKWLLLSGMINAFLAITLGAFGAHALKNKLSDYSISIFDTAVQYHFYHALALIICGLLLSHWPNFAGIKWSGYAFFMGILFFCGSLYLLSITGARWLGMITPIGGLLFLVGWLILCITFFKENM